VAEPKISVDFGSRWISLVMHRRRLTLGMDLSTQSLSSVVIDIDSGEKVLEH